MKMLNAKVLVGVESSVLENWAEKVARLGFHEIHDADGLFWLFATTPEPRSVRDGKIRVGKKSVWNAHGYGKAKDGHGMMVRLGGMWDGKKWHRELIGDKITKLMGECLKSRLEERYQCSYGEALMREEKSWKSHVKYGCENGHNFSRFGKVSVTCTNMTTMVTPIWVEKGIGSGSHGGDMAGGETIREVVKIGIGMHVSYPSCGKGSPGLIKLNTMAADGKVPKELYYDLVRRILGVEDATEKEINRAMMGSDRRMGLRVVKEWKPEDLLDANGVKDANRVRELKIGGKSHEVEDDGTATRTAKGIVGTRQHQGRLRSKQSKARADVDGKLKGVRVNGMRTELPADWSQDAWFQVWVDGKPLVKAQSCKDVIGVLLAEGEIPDWAECGMDMLELLLEEFRELSRARKATEYEVSRLKALIMEPPSKPVEVLLMLGLAMDVRQQTRVALRKSGVKKLPKELKVDLVGGEGRVDIGLWKKMEFAEVKPEPMLGEALWKAIVAQVEAGKEPVVAVPETTASRSRAMIAEDAEERAEFMAKFKAKQDELLVK